MVNLIKLHLSYKEPLELALGGLVEFDAGHEIVAVLERGARTRLAGYDPGPSDADANEPYRAIRAFLARTTCRSKARCQAWSRSPSRPASRTVNCARC